MKTDWKYSQADWLTDENFILWSQVFDNYAVTVMIGGEPYTLGLFDTAGMFMFSLIQPNVLEIKRFLCFV